MRPRVLGRRLLCAVETTEQVGARGVEVLVAVEPHAVDQRKPGLRPFGLGDGDRSVQLHDG
jgi:hypothetical protein